MGPGFSHQEEKEAIGEFDVQCRDMTIPELSVVAPVLNEEANIPELHRRLLATVQTTGPSFEILYVDAGSSDGSLEILRDLAVADPRVALLAFSRNFGHQIALSAGLDHARGNAVILMDSDLQDPPELIPDLLARWKEGFDVVYAQRKARPGESRFKRASAYLFYRVLRTIASVDVPPDTGAFRLLSRKAADARKRIPERGRFIRGLVAWIGFRQGRVLYDRPARSRGESKYRLTDMIRLAMTGAFSFSRFPIFLLGAAGSFLCLSSLLALGFGAPAVAGAVIFLGGIQLIGLWVLGQYLVSVVEEARRRPLYILRESVNLQSNSSRPARDA